MKRSKRLLFILILFIALGFAGISTVLYINSSAIIGADVDAYVEGIIFSDANTELGSSAIISNDGKSIAFNTKDLKTKNDISRLDYTITNNSSIDGLASIECKSIDESNIYSKYLLFDTDKKEYLLRSKESQDGYMEVKLTKVIAEDINVDFVCTLEVVPYEYAKTTQVVDDKPTVTFEGENVNFSNDVKNIEVGNFINVFVKPEDGYVLDSANCTNDYIVEVEFGAPNEVSAKVINPGTNNNSICTFTTKEYEIEGAVAEIVRTGKKFLSVSSALDSAKNNDTIRLLDNSEENVENEKNVTIDLNQFELVGSVVNNNNLTLLNGTIKSTSVAIKNEGSLTLGIDDENINSKNCSTSDDGCVIIESDSVGIEQNGDFDFYDGNITAPFGLVGGYNKSPLYRQVDEGDDIYYSPHVDQVESQQYVYLSGDDTAIAKTTEGGDIYYYNLQDAINVSVRTGYKLTVIRDFEASYSLNIPDKTQSFEYDFTGSENQMKAGKTGKYTIEVWGAQGGYSLNNGSRYSTNYGYGGYAKGEINLNAGEIIYINVGGKGADGAKGVNAAGGYNGGGNGTWDNSDDESSGAGGGATHVAFRSGLLKDLSEDKDSIIIVAGGGGGSSWTMQAGAGGGFVGGSNYYTNQTAVNQTTGYQFGQGQNASGVADSDGVGGGGGGYYGGYMNNVSSRSSGEGGSGFIGSDRLFNGVMYCYSCQSSDDIKTKTISTNTYSDIPTSNVPKAGNGYVKITTDGDEAKPVVIDTNGYNITVGDNVLVVGTLKLVNSKEEKGNIVLSKVINNKGNLFIENNNLSQESNVPVINNNGNIDLKNSLIQGSSSYGIEITGSDSNITMDSNSLITSSGNHGLLVDSGVNTKLTNVIATTTLKNGYAIANQGTLEIDGAYIRTQYYGIHNSGTITLNNIDVEVPLYGLYNSGTSNLNSGRVISTGSNAIYDANNTIINGGLVEANGTPIGGSGTVTINDGTINSKTNYVINHNGTNNINGGTLTGTSGIYFKGSTIINGGTINTTSGEGIHAGYSVCYTISCDNYNGYVTMNGGTINSYGTAINVQYGSFTVKDGNITSQNGYGIQNTSSESSVQGGNVRSLSTYGIYSTKNLNIGINDGEISSVNPKIVGNTYGVYIAGGTTGFYDGILEGKVAGYYGTISVLPDSTYISDSADIIDEEEYLTNSLVYEEPYLQVGTKTYKSFDEALSDIESTGTIKLIEDKNINYGFSVPNGKKITFDLNGHRITSTVSFTNNGELILIDSSEDQTGSISSDESTTVTTFTNNRTMTVKSGTINSKGVGISNSSSLTIDGGVINTVGTTISSSGTTTINDGYISSTSSGDNVYSSGTIIVNGGTIVGVTSYGIAASGANGRVYINGGDITGPTAVYIVGSGVMTDGNITSTSGAGVTLGKKVCGTMTCTTYEGYLTMNGGNINASGYGINASIGGVTVNGGSIISENSYGIYNVYTQASVSNAYIRSKKVSGIYSNKNLIIGTENDTIDESLPEIIGYTYGVESVGGSNKFFDGIIKGITDSMIGSFVEFADGSILNSGTDVIDGIEYNTLFLSPEEPFLQVGDERYNSFTKAINAIDSSGTITLIKSISTKYDFVVPKEKTITFDLNNNTIESSVSITNNGNLTIDDLSSSGNGSINNTKSSIIINKGTLNIVGGTLNASGYAVDNSGILNIEDGIINSDNTVISSSGTIVVNGGIINAKASGSAINTSGTAEINDGNVISNNGVGIYTSAKASNTIINGGSISGTNAISLIGKLTLNDGIIAGTNNGILVGRNKCGDVSCVNYEGYLTFNDGDISSNGVGVNVDFGSITMNGGNISATGTGVESTSEEIFIIDGRIESEEGYGIYSSTTLTLGVNDSYTQYYPLIIGKTYGLYIKNCNVNYYDGLITGQIGSYYGTITNVSEGYMIYDLDYEEEGITYYTASLMEINDYIFNARNNKNYNSLKDAIQDCESGDVLTITDYGYNNSSAEIPENLEITIDLNAQGIYTMNSIVNNGILHIVDSGNKDDEDEIISLKDITLLINNNIADFNDVDIANYYGSSYSLVNNGIIIMNNSNINGDNAINNLSDMELNSCIVTGENISINNSGNLKITDTEIFSFKSTAIKNSGQFELSNTTIHSETYGIYDTGIKDNSISNNSTLDKIYNTSSNIIINDSSVGDINNISGNIQIDNSSTGIVSNGGILSMNKVMMLGEVYSNSSIINNSGTLTITNFYSYCFIGEKDLTIKYINNSGVINADEIYYGTYNTYNTYNSFYGVYNTGTVNLSKDININSQGDVNSYYGVYNTGTIISPEINIDISNCSSGYGIYNDGSQSNINIKSGTINVSGANVYGVYINNGEVIMGTKEATESVTYGTEFADVSEYDPTITAIGSSNGIGVKNINGSFRYYDGSIIGSTSAVPDTITETEYMWERRDFVIDGKQCTKLVFIKNL